VRERLLRSEVDGAGLLYLYRRIHNGQMIADDETNSLRQYTAGFSGITRGSKGYLQVRNRIYWQVFDGSWIQTNMPQAEVRRQRRAGRRGMLIGFGAAVLSASRPMFLLALCTLVITRPTSPLKLPG
jgi:hypothetical protein